jgi:hypothetical protein
MRVGASPAPEALEAVREMCTGGSARAYPGLEERTLPSHEHAITVTHCSRTCTTAGQAQSEPRVCQTEWGGTQVNERVWLVTFMHYDLGYSDDEAIRLEPIDSAFAPKVLPMSSE